MNRSEFNQWQTKAIKAMGLRIDEAGFIDAWEKTLSSIDFRDAMEALRTIPADRRVVKTPPRDRLPLIVEHATEACFHRDKKHRQPVATQPDSKQQPAAKSWNEAMLRLGAIDRKEFDQRERERNRKC